MDFFTDIGFSVSFLVYDPIDKIFEGNGQLVVFQSHGKTECIGFFVEDQLVTWAWLHYFYEFRG